MIKGKSLSGLTDDKFAAKKDGKYGYINYKNEIVADFVFDEEPYYLLSNGNVFIKKIRQNVFLITKFSSKFSL